MRLPVNYALPFVALILLSGCGGGGAKPLADPNPLGVNGPAADYPIVLGEPFTVGGTTYTPSDRLNYDEVGYAVAGSAGGDGITVANKTLPLPSYAEVTSLDTGKTVLARVERRGPLINDRLVELSPGAAAQLGLTGTGKAPIRIRRVNPPEIERAMLRRGGQASSRMDTPPSLLTVLKRKLDPALVIAPTPMAVPSPTILQHPLPSPLARPKPEGTPKLRSTPNATAVPRQTPSPPPRPAPIASPAPPVTGGTFFVQVGSFANPANANAVSRNVGGSLRGSGRISRVIMGPFATHSEAQAALARARAAGYRDAQIQGGR
jgi:rare lipoprotein A